MSSPFDPPCFALGAGPIPNLIFASHCLQLPARPSLILSQIVCADKTLVAPGTLPAFALLDGPLTHLSASRH